MRSSSLADASTVTRRISLLESFSGLWMKSPVTSAFLIVAMLCDMYVARWNAGCLCTTLLPRAFDIETPLVIAEDNLLDWLNECAEGSTHRSSHYRRCIYFIFAAVGVKDEAALYMLADLYESELWTLGDRATTSLLYIYCLSPSICCAGRGSGRCRVFVRIETFLPAPPSHRHSGKGHGAG